MFACTSDDSDAPQNAFGCICHTPAFAALNAQLSRKMSRRAFIGGATAMGAAAFLPRGAAAKIPDAPKTPVAFTNIRLFDGKSAALRTGLRVVVDGNTIKAVEPADKPLPSGLQVIDGGGRTLMPGMIDAHVHLMMASLPMTALMTADIGFINLAAAQEAEATLMRGFTTVRDMAGPAFGLKRAIDMGMIAGPRIYPSGAMISQTAGHGDYRMPYEVPTAPAAPLSHGEVMNAGIIADGADAVLKRTREQLMLGATQIKLAAGGGVASNYDPIDVSEYTEPEFRAAVEAAENWGTYVAVHAYTARAIQTALRAGVRSIEHGQLMDEPTAKIIADKGAWFSSQPFLLDEDANPYPPGSANAAKQAMVAQGTDAAFGFARTYKLKTAWGTDTLFSPQQTVKQGKKLAKMVRWYTPAEVLAMATSANAELCAMCGPRNPYPAKLGVIEDGAFADILLVDGDPIADIQLIADPSKNLVVIMKDGRIFKNTLG